MVQVESLVGLGDISGPGRWGFGDSLEIGVPGDGVLTWEETKSHLALFAITSQPLFLSNDLREGHVQPRLIGLFKNQVLRLPFMMFTGCPSYRLRLGTTLNIVIHQYRQGFNEMDY